MVCVNLFTQLIYIRNIEYIFCSFFPHFKDESFGNEYPNAIYAQYPTEIQDIIKHNSVQGIVK